MAINFLCKICRQNAHNKYRIGIKGYVICEDCAKKIHDVYEIILQAKEEKQNAR